jgi:hypothetical protein
VLDRLEVQDALHGAEGALRSPEVPIAKDELEVAGVRAALAGGDDLSEVHVQQDRIQPDA